MGYLRVFCFLRPLSGRGGPNSHDKRLNCACRQQHLIRTLSQIEMDEHKNCLTEFTT